MPLTKIQILVKHTGEKLQVLFNPEEYTINKDNNFASQGIPGLSGPLLQFVNGNMRTLEMELFFDTYDSKSFAKADVRTETNKIVKLMAIDPALHAPPVLQVSWSSLQMDCVLARVSQKFILFAEDGTPVRARLTCTFNEYIDPEREGKEISRQTADFSKVYVPVDGETVSGIAAKVYDSAELWRPIAIRNGIDFPRTLAAGQSLVIPSLPATDLFTGEARR
jgi:LysM repeat protein